MRRRGVGITLVAFVLGALSAHAPLGAQSRRGNVSLDTVTFAPALDVDISASKRIARGLYVRDFIEGAGRWVHRGDEVTVRYVGSLADGQPFTAPNESPAAFKLGARTVIEGWERGITGMRVGGRRQLIIAPDLGYRDKQQGSIPPYSVLVFEIELLSVK